jgi:hypothetical protein
MIRWNPLPRRDVAEYSFLQVVVAAHAIASFFFHSDESCLAKVAAKREFQKTTRGQPCFQERASTSGKRIGKYSDPKTGVSITCGLSEQNIKGVKHEHARS